LFRLGQCRFRQRCATLLLAWVFVVPSWGKDAAECQSPRLADVGWSDVTATTAVMTALLTELGYTPKVDLLSVPVTFEALKRGDIDIFLGNWMPAQTANITPYLNAHDFDVITTNLEGAKYTLAVTDETWHQGVRDFSDIATLGEALGRKIYGIEPGNDGNRHVLDLIKRNEFNLGKFQLVESSEQGMLAQVDRAVAAHKPIVFLAWAPHPMNRRFAIHYLTGGDRTFGPNFGSASVRTLMRPAIKQQCPSLLKLSQQLQFSVDDENELMEQIAASHDRPDVIARRWLDRHPEQHHRWLSGITPQTAAVGLSTVLSRLAMPVGEAYKLPVGPTIAMALEQLKSQGQPFFKGLAWLIQLPVDAVNRCVRSIPTPLFLLLLALISYAFKRSWTLTLFLIASMMLIINLGYWSLTLDTLALVLVATSISMALGVPLGVLSAHHRWFHHVMNPVLDLMQTLPSFVYLIPTLVLFGLGTVPAVIATVIFAIPFPIRLTQLGIQTIEPSLLEAAEAFGASRTQTLWWVELPAARASILQGLTQCIMASLSMVVIAALVGASGLGVPVVRALNTVSIGDGFEAGLSIVLLAIALDRLFRPRERVKR